METKEKRIHWHPAFFEAIQMELAEYSQDLQFIPEHPLTTEPLRIDVVIIKKSRDITIKKNIAVIFREWNLLEYKSPNDYVSVDDFYKVYGYACLYRALNKVDIKELTLTFVGSRYPRGLLAHLREVRGYTVEETSPGIYTVSGDVLPIQVIDSRKLSAEENLWLKSLSNEHDIFTIDKLGKEIDKKGKDARLEAYLYAILTANFIVAKEALKMKDTFERFYEETGLAAKAEARGETRGITRGIAVGEARGRNEASLDIARKLKAAGRPSGEIAEFTSLPAETIAKL